MPKGECFLIGAEAWALQVGLGVLAFLSLVYKRFKVRALFLEINDFIHIARINY